LKFSAKQFRQWPHKCITLLGMSGVGKTRLANNLRRSQSWFHYSGDYRIGTRYLDEPILDNIKNQAMQVPFLRELLRSDSIYIRNNISFDNLHPVSSFIGKLGDPLAGGLPLDEFKRRQRLHREAEIAAMLDLPEFVRKAQQIYGYAHIVNDAGGSLCELDEPEVLQVLAQHSLILYIHATQEDQDALLERARHSPKPLYYREPFLDQNLAEFMRERQLDYVAQIDPDELYRWIFPRLFYSRIPRYQAIADQYGYTVSTSQLAEVRDEEDFLDLICQAIDQQERQACP
jgi:shikimate kinase